MVPDGGLAHKEHATPLSNVCSPVLGAAAVTKEVIACEVPATSLYALPERSWWRGLPPPP